MTINIKESSIKKLKTEISGFDLIANGGLPKGRSTLISGTAGSAKTIFAAQFLAEGILKAHEPGVFVTFEEPPFEISRNMMGFGWDIERWEHEGQWSFVDVSPQPSENVIITGQYDLGGLMARIEYAVKKIKAKRISLDSIGAIFTQFLDSVILRKELFRIVSALKEMGVTAVLTAERTQEYGDIARYGIEEFVADNVIILRNVLEEEKRRRTIEILKFRGTSHHKGEHPFTVVPDEGIIVIPLSSPQVNQKSSNTRLASGNRELDVMCGDGFFRNSIILVSGATGTGKTLIATEFIKGGIFNDERSLFLSFGESRQQFFQKALGWGIDFENMERGSNLKLICNYPEAAGLEDHFVNIKNTIKEFKPNRIVIDSLSAFEPVFTLKSFRQFIISLASYLKDQEITALFTYASPTLLGGTSITEANISGITDTIILLRYVEIYGEMHRGLTILKMRGSQHDKNIREFTITDKGMQVGHAFRNITGILGGNPVYATHGEIERMTELFK